MSPHRRGGLRTSGLDSGVGLGFGGFGEFDDFVGESGGEFGEFGEFGPLGLKCAGVLFLSRNCLLAMPCRTIPWRVLTFSGQDRWH